MILAQNFFAILVLGGLALPLLCKHIKHCKETQTTDVSEVDEHADIENHKPGWSK